MRLMCEERDTLWRHYDKALNRYTSSVEEMLGTTRMDCAPVVDARDYIYECRIAIKQHCTEHGCDPAFVKTEDFS
jgi:hypothetical protein